MAAAPSLKEVILNIIYDIDTNKVVYAYAEKSFIDILVSYLTLPLGTLSRLFEDSEENTLKVGNLSCVHQIRKSLDNLSETHLSNGSYTKQLLLNPINTSENHCSSLSFNIDPNQPTNFFMCSNHPQLCKDSLLTLTTTKGMKCACGKALVHPTNLKHSPSCGGFVKNSVAMYVIKDDLSVVPFWVNSCCLSLLGDTGLEKIKSLKERQIVMTKNKMIHLLKCCMLSKFPLTNFLSDQFCEQDVPKDMVCESDFEHISGLQIQLNLLLNVSDETIVLAYTREDFVEVLISFLTFPLGSIVKKLNCNTGLENIDTLYKSVTEMDEETYLMSRGARNCLLNPLVAHKLYSEIPMLPYDRRQPDFNCYYDTNPSSNKFYITREVDRKKITVKKISFVQEYATGSGNRFLKGPTTYVVHKNLRFSVLTPNLESLPSLGHYNDDLDSLKEKVIIISMRECLQILKVSLTSPNALEYGLQGFLREVKEASAGLFNLGNTCYMNSTLQCLHSVPELKLALMKYSDAGRNNDVDEACHDLTIATCHLFTELDESVKPVRPTQFWMVLREKYPQYNQLHNGVFMQQDAEECWTQLLFTISQSLRYPGSSENTIDVVKDLFGIELSSRIYCQESNEESSDTESVYSLKCYISHGVNNLHKGLIQGLKSELEKASAALGRNAKFMKESHINVLPRLFQLEVGTHHHTHN